MQSLRLLSGVLLVAIGCLPNCGCTKSTEQAAAPSSTLAAKAEPLTVTPEMERVAKHIEQGITNRHGRIITNCLDCEVLTDRITAGLEVPVRLRKDLLASLRKQIEQLDQNLAKIVAQFSLLQVRVKDGEVRALYRVEPMDGGVNYLDFLLVRSADGCVRVGDIFIYLTATDFSQSIRRPLILGLEHDNRGLLDRLTGKESLLIKHMDIVEAMNKALQADDNEGVLALYQRLPGELQDHRMILEMRMLASQSVDEQEYAAAIDAMAKHADGNPAINLLLIDAFALRKQPAAALECVEKLDALLGGDPFLDALRAVFLAETDKQVAAKAAIDRALAAFPDRRETHGAAVAVALMQRRFEHVMYELHVLETDFGLSLDIEADPRYAEFVASPQYQTWKVQHEAPDDLSQATGVESRAMR